MGRKIPAEEGLFDIPEETDGVLYLNGSKCDHCGRYFFPKSEFCPNCPSSNMEDVKIGRRGKLYTFTNCFYQAPGGHYKGKIPYGMGMVLLEEDIIIATRLTETDTSKMKAGMDVRLVLETFYEDAGGNEVVFFAYEPKP